MHPHILEKFYVVPIFVNLVYYFVNLSAFKFDFIFSRNTNNRILHCFLKFVLKQEQKCNTLVLNSTQNVTFAREALKSKA